MSEQFDERLPAIAYDVRLEDRDLYWLEQTNGETIRHDVEPGWKCENCDACDGGLVVTYRRTPASMAAAG